MRAPVAVIRGGGDLATGTITRLVKSGFRVLVLEIEKPTVIRIPVSAAGAIFDGEITVEGVHFKFCKRQEEAISLLEAGQTVQEKSVPVIVDPSMSILKVISPDVLIDATLAKHNMGLSSQLADIVIALGPGFTAPRDCHAVIETSRGHTLGTIQYEGSAKPNTGVPGVIQGHSERRIVRSPGEGFLTPKAAIGEHVVTGQVIGFVDSKEVIAPLDGVLRGLIHESVKVKGAMKIGDIDPRDNKDACWSISDKARALGGSVLEAYCALSGGIKCAK